MEPAEREWLITNPLGSFAMGCGDRVPRRKYHGLWISRAQEQGPATAEHVLLDVFERWRICGQEPQGFKPLVNYDFGHGSGRDARALIRGFESSPEPRWTYELPGALVRSVRFLDDREGIEVRYEWIGGAEPLELVLAPLFSMRDLHSLSQENLALDGAIRAIQVPRSALAGLEFQPYSELSPVEIYAELKGAGECAEEIEGVWYKNFFYEEEARRGYPASEDCFSPIEFRVKLAPGSEARLRFTLGSEPTRDPVQTHARKLGRIRESCGARPLIGGAQASFAKDLAASLSRFVYADARARGVEGLIAGYPWFSSWARDTMVCLPGLSLATGEPDFALKMLKSWRQPIEEQLFHGRSTAALNASGLDSPLLWGAALQFLVERHPSRPRMEDTRVAELMSCLERWLVLLFQGECPRLQVTDFGLLCVPGAYAATWMDAVVEGTPVTPRHGYPVEVNALFFECMDFLLRCKPGLRAGTARLFRNYLEKVQARFADAYWVGERSFVGDRHDGVLLDSALRPNLLWAISGQVELFPPERAAQALQRVTDELLTPFGLRTLSPHDSRYRGVYAGDQAERDRSYHQGTAWPWLLGKYTEAALKAWGPGKTQATLAPVLEALKSHFYEGPCPGQISEIFDGDSPHTPRGAPAQAWSVAEVLRMLWLIENAKS